MNNSFGLVLDLNDLIETLGKKQQKNLGEFSPNTFSFEIGLFSTRMILLKKKKHGIVKKAEELGV
jgi:hypothetical protein